MKKMSLILLLMICWGVVQAQTAVKVPTAVQTKFDSIFTGASEVKWAKSGVDYQADFKLNKKSMKAKFDKNGVYLEKQLSIDQSALPENAKNYILTNHSGKNVLNVYKVTKANGRVTYTASVGGKLMTFDATGNHLSG